MNSKLIFANFDARIPKIEIMPRSDRTKIAVHSKMYDEKLKKNVNVSLVFSDVAAIDFRINFFDNMIGCEAFGLYEITDSSFKNKLTQEIFERRKEIFLFEGDYGYEDDEPADLLNTFDLYGIYAEAKENYHLYVQNVDAGVYIIMAKSLAILHQKKQKYTFKVHFPIFKF